MGTDNRVFKGDTLAQKFLNFLVDAIEQPVIWVRENVVLPNRQEYYWYHERLRRVPTVDECYTDDIACIYEADEQFLRDKRVERNILYILKKRYELCIRDHPYDREFCQNVKDTWDHAVENFFIKYGDLAYFDKSRTCYMKQKHRLAWERRHGPVGTGMRPEPEDSPLRKKKTC